MVCGKRLTQDALVDDLRQIEAIQGRSIIPISIQRPVTIGR